MDYEHSKAKVVNPQEVVLELKALFYSQGLAVVSTHEQGQPYCSLVAFAATDDLKHLIFSTTRATRKYSNIYQDHRISMLIDNRSNKVSDFHEAMAVSVMGQAQEVDGPAKDRLLKVYMSKHPHLDDFVMSPSSALIDVQVSRYFVVTRFQHVLVLNMIE